MSGSVRLVKVALVAAVSMLLASCAGVTSRHDRALPPPPTTIALPELVVPQIALPATADVELNVLDGTSVTTGVGVAGGSTTVRGTLSVNNAAIAGATVEVERIVGNTSAALTTTTDAQGNWEIKDVLGGRYRLRAWRAPDVAVTQPAILFADASSTATVDLAGQLIGPVEVSAAAAPTSAAIDDEINVGFRLESRAVDPQGIVRTSQLGDIGVTIDGATNAELQSGSPVSRSTRRDGQVQWTMRCTAAGPLSVTMSFGVEGGGRDSRTFALAQCG